MVAYAWLSPSKWRTAASHLRQAPACAYRAVGLVRCWRVVRVWQGAEWHDRTILFYARQLNLGGLAHGNREPTIQTVARTAGQTVHGVKSTAVLKTISLNAGVPGVAVYRTTTPLPAGLSLDNSSGVISGKLSQAGNTSVRVQAVNIWEGDRDVENITTFNFVVAPTLREQGTRGLQITQGSVYEGTVPEDSHHP